MWTSTREAAATLDSEDELAELRNGYHLQPGVIHLDGSSVGTRGALTHWRRRTFTHHRRDSIVSHSKPDSDARSEAELAATPLASLIGAAPAEITVAESTSMHLFTALLAAAKLRPKRSVIVLGNSCFPTDRYLARSAAEFTGSALRVIDTEAELPDALNDQVAIVALSHVDLLSGAVRDTSAITSAIHRAGALSLWDLSGSAGALHVDLHDWDADFALGCGYKYLGGGSGSPAYAYVAARHQPELSTVLPSMVGFGSGDVLNPLASRAVCAPSPQSVSGLRSGLSLLDGVSASSLEKKTHALVNVFLDRLGENAGIDVIAPRGGQTRGSHVSLRHRHAQYLVQGLSGRGILTDFLEPDVIRFSFAPAWLRYVDVWEAADALRDVLNEIKHRSGR